MVSDRSPNLGVLENTTGDRPEISFSLVKLGDFGGVPHRATHFPGMMDFRYSKVVLPQLFLLVYKPH